MKIDRVKEMWKSFNSSFQFEHPAEGSYIYEYSQMSEKLIF